MSATVRVVRDRARAEAPASTGNIASGFDLLGFAVGGWGDVVGIEVVDEPGVSVAAITGTVTTLPLDAERNTAARAVASMRTALGLTEGFRLTIHKGIPLGSGLGGSAASASAAVTALNSLLDAPLSPAALYPYALDGEFASSGARHGDNVGPQLLGGIAMSTAERCLSLPVPAGIYAVVVHPDFVLETRRAREVLAEPYALKTVIGQTASLGQLIAGLYRDEDALIIEGLRDVLVEPRRAPLIPGFAEAKAAALAAGALGASISGAGPTVFAWVRGAERTESVAAGIAAALGRHARTSTRIVELAKVGGARLLPD
jgi:homoserine kinase